MKRQSVRSSRKKMIKPDFSDFIRKARTKKIRREVLLNAKS